MRIDATEQLKAQQEYLERLEETDKPENQPVRPFVIHTERFTYWEIQVILNINNKEIDSDY